jgi:hypothetical protein
MITSSLNSCCRLLRSIFKSVQGNGKGFIVEVMS